MRGAVSCLAITRGVLFFSPFSCIAFKKILWNLDLFFKNFPTFPTVNNGTDPDLPSLSNLYNVSEGQTDSTIMILDSLIPTYNHVISPLEKFPSKALGVPGGCLLSWGPLWVPLCRVQLCISVLASVAFCPRSSLCAFNHSIDAQLIPSEFCWTHPQGPKYSVLLGV